MRSPRRSLRHELLEARDLLAADTYLINFQSDEATTPTRYLEDVGDVFGDRGGGLSYGWSSDHIDQARERSLAADQRFDTLIHFEFRRAWEFALPDGRYEITVAVGDPGNNDGVHTVNVEGADLFDAVPDTDEPQIRSIVVDVNDGRLTLDQGLAAEKATRINYVHIVGVSAGGNAAPAMPLITEPVVDGQVVNPTDVHMEAVGYFDSEGDPHTSTDWEIWTVGADAELVWQTLGIEGVERLHTHLGDGIFVGSLAGESELASNTEYQLRARYRDDAGSVSGYATRLFTTGAASTIFPMELQDIAPSPEPSWVTTTGFPVELPAGAPPPPNADGIDPSLRIESAGTRAGLLVIAAEDAPGNAVTDFPALADHEDLRIVVDANGSALDIPESDLTLTGDGQQRTLFLPAITLQAGEQQVLWIDSAGSTYFGASGQSEPDFSTIARAASLTIPFIATEPGFVIEEVGADYRLPVNIAFVPNPGPEPDDPLYFVNELYGSIQVVTRDGTKHEFATGLLDYNPDGPISGSGEQGLTGLAVARDEANPELYHLYVGMLWDNGDPPGGASHYPKVERITSVAGGLAMDSRTVLLNMQPETQGQSHQISNISIGPDGLLYVHNGDGFDASTGLDLDQYRGKILRMNLDGSAADANPFYNSSDGISARDYVFAYGFRNPFGGDWRASDGKLYTVENGPSVDRFAQVNEGVSYGWNGSNASMQVGALYNWTPSHAPVNIAFVQPETFGGSGFPSQLQDMAFVSESGPTYAPGPQALGKRLTYFGLDSDGELEAGPETLVEYVGAGRGSVVALAAGPDGLYFSEFYEDSGDGGPTASGSRLFRVRYVNPLSGDYDIDGDVDVDDYVVWKNAFGSRTMLAADGNRDGIVDMADFTIWRDGLSEYQAALSSQPPSEGSIDAGVPSRSQNVVNRSSNFGAAIALGVSSREASVYLDTLDGDDLERPGVTGSVGDSSELSGGESARQLDPSLILAALENSSSITTTESEEAFAALSEEDDLYADADRDNDADRWPVGSLTNA
ncbi:MAG: PQQ-dependent sugar dehydrogenase [Planctomycetota bacterium]